MTTPGGVKRTFAHQAVHASLGAQVAKRVLTLDFDGGGLDAGNITLRFFEYLGFETLAFTILEVLAQQHRGPVLCLRATCTCLNIQKAVQWVSRVGEHPAKLHSLENDLKAVRVLFDGFEGGVIAVSGSQLKQFQRILDRLRERTQGHHNIFETLFFSAQVLGMLGVVPDSGVF